MIYFPGSLFWFRADAILQQAAAATSVRICPDESLAISLKQYNRCAYSIRALRKFNTG
jgi:hypothetical protein